MRLKEPADIKLYILTLMLYVDYPLRYSQINDVVVQDEFVNYFDFAECFAELLDMGTIEQIIIGDGISTEATIGENGRPEKKNELYTITENGIIVVEQLQSNLLNMIKEKNMMLMRKLALSLNINGSMHWTCMNTRVHRISYRYHGGTPNTANG